jgi:hypothetical protein
MMYSRDCENGSQEMGRRGVERNSPLQQECGGSAKRPPGHLSAEGGSVVAGCAARGRVPLRVAMPHRRVFGSVNCLLVALNARAYRAE